MNQYIAAFILLAPILPILYGVWLLARQGAWFIAWIRGCAMVLGVSLLGIFVLCAVEITRLHAVDRGEQVAKVSITDAIDNSLVTIDYQGQPYNILMQGDAVEVYARAMQFSGPLSFLVPDTFLHLGRVQNRYYAFDSGQVTRSLEIKQGKVSIPYLKEKLTAWKLLSFAEKALAHLGIHYQVVFVSYIPMVDGAKYNLIWDGRRQLDVTASNQLAKNSLVELVEHTN